jgi:hypothetical protein
MEHPVFWQPGYDPGGLVRIVQVFADGTMDEKVLCEGYPLEAEFRGFLPAAGQAETFSVDLPPGIHTVGLAGNPEANFDLFARWGAPPSGGTYDAASQAPSSMETLKVAGSGTLYLTVRSVSGGSSSGGTASGGAPSGGAGPGGGAPGGTVPGGAGAGRFSLSVVFGDGKRKTLQTVQFSGPGDSRTWRIDGAGHHWAFLSGPDPSDLLMRVRWNAQPTATHHDDQGKVPGSQQICNGLCRDRDGKGIFFCTAECLRGGGRADLMVLQFGP